jgi:hypothetical protein
VDLGWTLERPVAFRLGRAGSLGDHAHADGGDTQGIREGVRPQSQILAPWPRAQVTGLLPRQTMESGLAV